MIFPKLKTSLFFISDQDNANNVDNSVVQNYQPIANKMLNDSQIRNNFQHGAHGHSYNSNKTNDNLLPKIPDTIDRLYKYPLKPQANVGVKTQVGQQPGLIQQSNNQNQDLIQKADNPSFNNNMFNADLGNKDQQRYGETNHGYNKASDTGAKYNNPFENNNFDTNLNRLKSYNKVDSFNNDKTKNRTQDESFSQKNAIKVNLGQNQNKDFIKAERYNEYHVKTREESYLHNRDIVKKPKVIPKSKTRPDIASRKDVIWMEEYHGYSLRASVDNRFRIRYAPIPSSGAPWPLPQFYTPEAIQFQLKPEEFRLNAAGENCDILDFALERVRKNIFGKDIKSEDESSNKKEKKSFSFFRDNEDDELVELKSLNVTVLKECGQFPQLDMDESCKYKPYITKDKKGFKLSCKNINLKTLIYLNYIL
jgi:hypothetical protein